jgi:two-component system NtrC family sensor kinase
MPVVQVTQFAIAFVLAALGIFVVRSSLLKNAVEAMPQGGTVMIRCIESTEPVTVQVLDEGVGFPSSLRANLFQPFFTRKPQGAGLGLSMCREIAEFYRASFDLLPRTDGRGTIARVVFSSNLRGAQNEAVGNPRSESIAPPANSGQRA